MTNRKSALDAFFSDFFDGVTDKVLISDHAKCHESSAWASLRREASCLHSTPIMNRWDEGGGQASLGFPLSPPPPPPSSSQKRAVEKVSSMVGPDGEIHCDNAMMGHNVILDFEPSSPKPTLAKKCVRMNEEVSVVSLSRSGVCDIRMDVSKSVRLKFPSSPPSSVEKRRAALKKKLMASSRWESESRNLSLFQLMSHSPPVRPTRGPNLMIPSSQSKDAHTFNPN